jgi:LysM repeat protein
MLNMKWERIADKEFLMKAKVIGLLVLAAHVIVLAGFSLLQGCTTGDCPIPWLNWPYSTSREPIIVPADQFAPIPTDEFAPVPMLPPPGVTAEPYAGGIEAQSYTVQKGDTLSSIASRYGTTWKKLAEFNGLSDPNKLRTGQELRIPSSLGAPASRTSAPPPPSESKAPSTPIKQGSSYVIQKGDTLSRIAVRAGLSIAELKDANSLSSDRIVAGKSLTIPKKGSVAAVSSAAPASKPEPAPAPAALEAAPTAAAPAATSASAPVYEHVLYPGETLEDVARQYGSSQQEIMTLNNITDPGSVKPGTKLLVPIPE